MWELKACTVCLGTDVKIFNMDDYAVRGDFNAVARLNTYMGNGLPNFLCSVCMALVKKFKKFQDQCHVAHYTLQEILNVNQQIDISNIKLLNREALNLKPHLAFWNTSRCRYEEIAFEWTKYNRINVDPRCDADVLTVSTVGNSSGNSQPSIKRLQKSTGLILDTTADIFTVTTLESNQLITKKKLKRLSDRIVETDTETQTSDYQGTTSRLPDYNVLYKNRGIKVEALDNTFEVEVKQIEDFEFDNDQKQTTVLDAHEVDDDLNSSVEALNNDYCDYNETVQVVDTTVVSQKAKVVDGSKFDEEYANVFALSKEEQKAVVEVYKMFTSGKHKCAVCSKGYQHEDRLRVHMRMHDKHISGVYFCELCCFYYKTEFLLTTHVTEKHLYKYVCTQCPEVSFDRASAKQHYIWAHLQQGNKKDANWYENRPSWISSRGGKRLKGVSKTGKLGEVTLRPVKKMKKYPSDFPIYSPISHLDQYALVQERKTSKNYLESEFKCELCYRGFREIGTYTNHLKKHDSSHSGPMQCDVCKLHFANSRKMYKHMIITHVFKYSCQMCHYVCYNRGQAHAHYRWHKNVTYSCPHCSKEFTKSSTRLTHIRIKHPSTDICNICGHSFVSETGLYFHMQKAHSKEEIETSDKLGATTSSDDKLYCADCKIQFVSDQAYMVHLGSSNKHATVNLSVQPRKKRSVRAMKDSKKRSRRSRGPSEILNNGVATATNCEECGKHLPNDVQARKHYKSEHPGADFLKRYMCDVCGHTTQQYNNLLVHMRTHTNEKPFACHYCDRRFSMTSNRDRHLVVHTGEKKFQCQHCNRRFTQSSAVKLHIQTVHLKIPYAPWDKKNRKRRKEMEACMTQPAEPKLLVDSEYINAYISYHDETGVKDREEVVIEDGMWTQQTATGK